LYLLAAQFGMLGAWVAAYIATYCGKKGKGEIMKISTLVRNLPVVMVICALGATASPAFSKEKGKAKAKGKDKIESKETVETKGKHGREAGELPYGLERHTEKKGGLPSGLQKKKDEDGQLTRGLENGGKKSKPTTKEAKSSK
jgi:hypothetical protein